MHHQAQVLQHPHLLLPHIHCTPREGSVPTALQCPNLQVPQQPLEVCPTGCFACPSIALLVLRQPGHGAIAGRREGGERVPPASTGFLSATGGSQIPSPPSCITLSVGAIVPSYGGGKAVLSVAAIKTGRGRHLLFSATAEIAFLATDLLELNNPQMPLQRSPAGEPHSASIVTPPAMGTSCFLLITGKR